MTAPRPGDTILLRAEVVSVGPDGWMTVKFRTSDDLIHLPDSPDHYIVINVRDPAIERGVPVDMPDEVA